MADAVAMKNFETSVKKIMTRWAKKVSPHLEAIEKLNKEIDKLEDKKELSKDEKDTLKKHHEARDKARKQVEKASLEAKIELMVVTPPPKEDKSGLLKKLTPIVKKFKDGLPLSNGWSLMPDLDVDLKKGKFKKFELKITWKF